MLPIIFVTDVGTSFGFLSRNVTTSHLAYAPSPPHSPQSQHQQSVPFTSNRPTSHPEYPM